VPHFIKNRQLGSEKGNKSLKLVKKKQNLLTIWVTLNFS